MLLLQNAERHRQAKTEIRHLNVPDLIVQIHAAATVWHPDNPRLFLLSNLAAANAA
jgi:hypothetical protein